MTWSLPSSALEAWCRALAGTLERQDIEREGRPYLVRYFVSGWHPGIESGTGHIGPAVFLHHFLAGDARDVVHSHPWAWSASLVLVGGYRELRCGAMRGQWTAREYRPGQVNYLLPTDRHRIELLEAEAWTLFLAGPVVQRWTFSDC